ncbi:hypothetical protein MHYP_G00129510 [Metynnis hypsauchen]
MPAFKIIDNTCQGVGPTAGERCDQQQLLSALTRLLSTNKRDAGELHAANPTGTDAELAQRGRTVLFVEIERLSETVAEILGLVMQPWQFKHVWPVSQIRCEETVQKKCTRLGVIEALRTSLDSHYRNITLPSPQTRGVWNRPMCI